MKTRRAVMLIHRRPVFDRGSAGSERACHACHDDVGQRVLLQEAKQSLIKEAAVGAHRAQLPAIRHQCESLLQKRHHSASRTRIAAAQPTMQHQRSLREHSEQRMMGVTPWPRRVVTAQSPLLMAAALEHRAIEIQAPSRSGPRPTLQQ